DKFMNEGRAIINMMGNAIATIIISAWQKSFNHERARLILAERPVVAEKTNLVSEA
ncbi:MAG: C4-dicarboxylate transporter DctA, partial [Legionella sp.]